MATVIDCLVVSLGLDASGFKKGQKETTDALKKTKGEATRTAKEMEYRGAQAAEFFGKIKNQALGLAAVLMGGAGLKAFAGRIIESDAAVGRLADNLDMSVTSLSAWEGMAKRFGSSSEDIAGAFRNVNKIVQEITLTGNSSALIPLQRAGVDIQKFIASTTSSEERMRMLAASFHSMTAQQAQFWGQQAGFSEQTITMLRAGTGAIDAAVAKQKELSAATKQSADNAIALKNAWSDLTDTVGGFGRKALNALNPTMIGYLHMGPKGPMEFINAWADLGKKVAISMGMKPSTKSDHASGQIQHGALPSSGSAPSSNKELFARLEKANGLPKGLLDSVWQQESGRGKNMLSSKGAKGHFQFMDGTAKAYGLQDPNNLNQSATKAAQMFKDLLHEFHGNLSKALAAYNWGSGHVEKNGLNHLPLETQRYIASIRSRMDGSSRTEVTVGQINIQTQATDATGIAKSIKPAVQNYAFASQGGTGTF